MIYLQKTDTGSTIGTYLYCNFAMMWSAEQMGIDSYIHWDKPNFLIAHRDNNKFKELPNAYDWYFIQPKVTNPLPKNECEVWVWETGWKDQPVSFIAQPLNIIRDYYKKNLIFNDDVIQRAQLIIDKYKIDFSKTIGVSWRGTDIYLESQNGNRGRKYFPIESYFKWIDKALEEIPDARIACTAEESGRLEPLFKRYPQAFLIEEFVQSPYGSKDNPEKINGNFSSGFESGLNPVLMINMFSRCAWYIKTRSSMASIASWLSDGKIVSIAHEETLSYLKMDDMAEFEGKRYPL